MTTSRSITERSGAAEERAVPERALRKEGAGHASPRELLLTMLVDPSRLLALELREWDILVRAARTAGMLSQLAMRAYAQALVDRLPAPVRPHLESARVVAERQRVVVEWEIGRIERALRHVDGPLLLLKGAAYQAIGLPTAAGRLTGDVDILVPRERLVDVERALLSAGWCVADLDPRDQAYFRRWMQELPPLVHGCRRTMLDVHHTILPSTDRLAVNPQLLIDASVPLCGRRSRVLAPADLFLHSAAHLFRNGAWGQGIRDLVDMDAMLRLFQGDERFWDGLLRRAVQLDLRVPCAAAIRALDRYVGTPIPESAESVVAGWQPRWPIRAVRDRLVERAMLPRDVGRFDHGCERARGVLAYWPVPRLRAMRTAQFWTKRLPRGRTDRRAEDRDSAVRLGGAPTRPDSEEGRDE